MQTPWWLIFRSPPLTSPRPTFYVLLPKTALECSISSTPQEMDASKRSILSSLTIIISTPCSPVESALTAQVYSVSSKPEAATSMSCHVSPRPLSTPLRKFQHSACSVPISTKTDNPFLLLPNKHLLKQHALSKKLRAWISKQWENWNTTSLSPTKNAIQQ